MAADRARRRAHVLRASLAASGAIYMLLGLFGERMPVWMLWALIAGASAALSPAIPLLNSIGMKFVGPGREENFAYFRALGSLGAAIAMAAGPWILLSLCGLDRTSLFLAGGALMAATALLTRWPAQKGGIGERPHWSEAAQLFRNRNLVWLYAVSTAMYFSLGGFYDFSGPYFQMLGAGETGYSMAWAIGVCGEVPLVLLLPRLIRRFGMKRLLAVSLACEACRCIAIAAAPNAMSLIVAWAFISLGVAGLYIVMPMYIASLAGDRLRSTAQAIGGSLLSVGLIGGVLTMRWIVGLFPPERLIEGYRWGFARTGLGLAIALAILALMTRDRPSFARAKATVSLEQPEFEIAPPAVLALRDNS